MNSVGRSHVTLHAVVLVLVLVSWGRPAFGQDVWIKRFDVVTLGTVDAQREQVDARWAREIATSIAARINERRKVKAVRLTDNTDLNTTTREVILTEARKAGVSYVLLGSYESDSPERVRIRVELVSVAKPQEGITIDPGKRMRDKDLSLLDWAEKVSLRVEEKITNVPYPRNFFIACFRVSSEMPTAFSRWRWVLPHRLPNLAQREIAAGHKVTTWDADKIEEECAAQGQKSRRDVDRPPALVAADYMITGVVLKGEEPDTLAVPIYLTHVFDVESRPLEDPANAGFDDNLSKVLRELVKRIHALPELIKKWE